MDPTEAFLARATRPLVVSDIDGVLNMLSYTIATALNARFGLSLLVSEMKTYRVETTLTTEQGEWLNAQFGKGSFYANAVADREAITALGALRAAGFRVVVATDRPVGTETATERWLDANGVGRDGFQIGPGCKRKLLAEYEPGNPAVLIEDNPETWLSVARPGVEVWTPKRPWITDSWQQYPNVFVFDRWAEVLDRLSIYGPQEACGIHQ